MKLLVALIVLLFGFPAHADEMRPLYVESRAGPDRSYAIKWRMPPNFAAQAVPTLVLPRDCMRGDSARTWTTPLGRWTEQSWRCRMPLEGRSVRVAYPRGNPNLSTIFKTVGADATSEIAVFRPSESELAYPAGQPQLTRGPFTDYLLLGIEHIWIGFDHLLFVSCLIWIAGTPGRVFQTITGFTLAHSLTLVLAALQLVEVPVRTVEVLIALSIVLLAVELARGRRDTLTWRRPVAVSAGFGLLHGFGFAAVLREIGLPEEGFVRALFAFNLGIEIGQLIFALALIVGTRLVLSLGYKFGAAAASDRRSLVALPPGLRLLIAYGVGITATCWMLQRAT